MFARVVTFEGLPQGVPEGAERAFRERVVPTAQSQSGFKGATALLDAANGKLIGITYWDTEDAARAADAALAPIRTEMAVEMGSDPPTTNICEVLGQV